MGFALSAPLLVAIRLLLGVYISDSLHFAYRSLNSSAAFNLGRYIAIGKRLSYKIPTIREFSIRMLPNCIY
jgi:hypothetical protein